MSLPTALSMIGDQRARNPFGLCSGSLKNGRFWVARRLRRKLVTWRLFCQSLYKLRNHFTSKYARAHKPSATRHETRDMLLWLKGQFRQKVTKRTLGNKKNICLSEKRNLIHKNVMFQLSTFFSTNKYINKINQISENYNDCKEEAVRKKRLQTFMYHYSNVNMPNTSQTAQHNLWWQQRRNCLIVVNRWDAK